MEAIRDIYAPIVRETIVSFETQAPSATELQERIDKSHEWLVYEREGRVVGYAYAAPFHERAGYKWSVEVSIYLGAEARGSGLGKELLSELLERLKERGFVNARHRHVGFKQGGWHDVGWWQLQLNAPTSPPPEVS